MMDWRENTTIWYNTFVKPYEWNVKWNNPPEEGLSCFNVFLVAVTVSSVWNSHLYELEDSEGGSAVVAEHEADDAEELSVEAAVAQTEQEAAEQRHADTEPQHTKITVKETWCNQVPSTEDTDSSHQRCFRRAHETRFCFVFAIPHNPQRTSQSVQHKTNAFLNLLFFTVQSSGTLY